METLIYHFVLESFAGGDERASWGRYALSEHEETSNNNLYMFVNRTGMVRTSKLEAWGLVTPSASSNRDYLPMHDVCNNFLLLGNAKSLIFGRFSHMESNKHSF